jgi:salicylate 5-hydroxylase large subunit
MSDPSTVFPTTVRWEREDTSRIPFLTYTSDELYQPEPG